MPPVKRNHNLFRYKGLDVAEAAKQPPSVEQLKAISLQVLNTFRKGPCWEDNKDRYRSPNGYHSWNRQLLHCLFHSSLDSIKLATAANDRAGMLVNRVCTEALALNAPVRYISKDLCESFLRTPCPRITHELLDVLPVFHLMLPKGSLVSEDGLDIIALVVCAGELNPRLSKREREEAERAAARNGFEIIPEEMEGAHGVQVAAITDVYSYSWVQFVDEKLNALCSADAERVEVQNLTEAIGRIAVNSLLVHLYEPELITTDAAVGFRCGNGFGSTPSKTLPATWIGKSFRVNRDRQRSPGSPESSRGPVQPHWRRGHWHTVLHGPGRQERRMQWFRPVYVNASR